MSINAEILMELLAEHNIWIGKDIAVKVAEQFAGHLSECGVNHSLNERKSSEREENFQQLINNLKYENMVYKNSVKEIRGASHIYIEDGEVKYDL